MAVLQKIRNRAGVLIIIFVGVALLLFIVDPSTFRGLFNKRETNIAVINGEKIPYTLYQNKIEAETQFIKTARRQSTLDEKTRENIRERVWKNLFNEYLMAESYDELGIDISEDELENMLWGTNIHPVIKNNFTNQETGKLDTMYVRRFFNQAEQNPESKIIADYFKKAIKRDQINKKYRNLLKKGFHTPTPLAKQDYINSQKKVDFLYIAKAYKSIDNAKVSVSEKDMKDYYKDHKYMFENKKSTRDIEYVSFDVIPSSQDSTSQLKELKRIKDKFKNTSDNVGFVNMHSDIVNRKRYFKKNEVPGNQGKLVFEEKDSAYISDIIKTDSSYMVYKFLGIETLPDSVKARHILINPDSTTTIKEAEKTIDSLKKIIEPGNSFDRLARNFSKGPSASKGGDLGWFGPGQMVKPFNDACFYGEEGDIKKVETQHGFHLIWVEKQSEKHPMARLAIINKIINPSDDTYQKTYAEASKFRDKNNNAEKFEKAVVEKNLVKKIASEIKENDKKISGIDNAREIVMWSFNAEQGEISDIIEVDNEKFVVAHLKKVKDKGIADFEQVKSKVKPIVLQKKKADILIEEMKNAKSSDDIFATARSLKTTADTARKISFNSFSIPGLGVEPKLIGRATKIEDNKIHGPVEGNNGVYLYKVINSSEVPETNDYTRQKMQKRSTFIQRVTYEMMGAIEEASDIEDNRSKFF